MSTPGAFWYLLGALSGVAAAFLLIPLLRHSSLSSPKRVALALGAALLPAVAALAFYGKTGSPALAGAPVPALSGAPAGHPAVATPDGDSKAGSLEEAVAKLESRVAAGGASDADWTLLAQSYEFLGRADDAARARQHVAGPPSAAPTGAPSTRALTAAAAAMSASAPAAPATTAIARAQQTAAQLEEAVKRNPKDAASWFGLAQAHRVAREFDRANEAYAKALALEPKNADAWADYADSLASTGGHTLAGKPAQALEHALALNPNHVKGLWLSASLALEQHRYKDALAQWRRLRAALPPDSPDISIIDANLAEAQQLAGQPASAAVPAKSVASAAIEGSVDVAAALKSQIDARMTLFIYAKTADGKGPPLAVIRQSVGSWPVRFRLDDSQAMMPGRNLSSVERVLVEARLSRSGNAIAEKGDLITPGTTLATHGTAPVKLTISRPVT
jgi:cytochrome c-type biogenesis protein CcmH